MPTSRSELLRLMRNSRVAEGITPRADTRTTRLTMFDTIIPQLMTATTVALMSPSRLPTRVDKVAPGSTLTFTVAVSDVIVSC